MLTHTEGFEVLEIHKQAEVSRLFSPATWSVRVCAFCILCAFLWIPSAAAQISGAISGTVRDESGRAVSDAKVTAKNTDTGTPLPQPTTRRFLWQFQKVRARWRCALRRYHAAAGWDLSLDSAARAANQSQEAVTQKFAPTGRHERLKFARVSEIVSPMNAGLPVKIAYSTAPVPSRMSARRSTFFPAYRFRLSGNAPRCPAEFQPDLRHGPASAKWIRPRRRHRLPSPYVSPKSSTFAAKYWE